MCASNFASSLVNSERGEVAVHRFSLKALAQYSVPFRRRANGQLPLRQPSQIVSFALGTRDTRAAAPTWANGTTRC